MHRGAQNGETSYLLKSAITRPFLKIEPWNVNKKIFFFNFKNENAKKKYFFFRSEIFYFFLKIFWAAFFLGWLRTLIFFPNLFFYQKEKVPCSSSMIPCLENNFSKLWRIFFFFGGQRGGGKKYFFNYDDVEPLIFWSLVFEFINHFLVERREKKGRGG